MSNAALAYARTAQVASSPRQLEADLLIKAASKLQMIRDDWSKAEVDLKPALLYNRKLWTIFMTSVTDSESKLPDPIRQNIANLGMFVMNRTLEVQADPTPDKLGALVQINRSIAAGLRGNG